MHEYEELRIRIWKTGRNRYLVFANGPEAAAESVHLLRSPQEYRQAFEELMEEEFDQRPPEDQQSTRERIRELGRELFVGLLPERVLDCLRKSHPLAQKLGKRLRVRFDAPDLMDIPFEILCSPPSSPLGELVFVSEISPVRSLRGLSQGLRLTEPTEEPEPISLLVIVSLPSGEEALGWQNEIRQLKGRLPKYHKATGAKILQTLGEPGSSRRPTRETIADFMREHTGPCAALIIAHGGYDSQKKESFVLLEREDGSAERVSGRILKGLLAQAPGLRLVVLNLCMGAKPIPGEPFSGLAQALIGEGISAVVAMQSEVSDSAASKFGPIVLREICQNRTIDEAVSIGRLQMADTGITWSEWSVPVLFLHEDCRHGWLFRVKGPHLPKPSRDPLEILRRAEDEPSPANMASAACLFRSSGEWERVADYADAGLETDPEDPFCKRLSQEAKWELHMADLQTVCMQLGREDDPDDARALLAKMRRAFSTEELWPFTQEVEQAHSLWNLYHQALAIERDADGSDYWRHIVGLYEKIREASPEGYRDAIARRAAAREELRIALLYEEMLKAAGREDWPAVQKLCWEISQARPQGYRDTASYLCYAEGRLAEEREDWGRAAEAYKSIEELREIFPDQRQRLPYACARAAESGDRWTEAVSHYALLPAGFEDSNLRFPYAQARAAELEELWEVAIAALSSLDRTHRDVRERRPYALGRLAEAEETWRSVIGGFGDLPDQFVDVGLRRNFARAKIAEGAEDYKRAVEALRDVPDEHRGGEVGRMRGYAQGRLAEEAFQWAEAAQSFAASGSYRDAALRRTYAEGRDATAAAEWKSAVAAFESLPESFRADVEPRREYARGRLAEKARDWPEAVAAFSRHPDWPPDTGQRLAGAKAHWAEERGEWEEVLEVLESVETAPCDIPRMRAYAQGRLAQDKEDWDAAAGYYVRCGTYADAADRWLYTRGRGSEIRGSWGQAIESYERLAADHRDAGERRQRLRKLLDSLPWVDGLADAGLIADPEAVREGSLPYEQLRKAGVHPGSPAEEVKDASFLLMDRDAMTPEARLAWDRVRSLEGRLKVDALLYRLRDPEGLRQVQRDLMPGEPGEVLQAVCRALPGDAPLALLLDGRREVAIEAWETLRRQAPEEAWVAHALALACFWRARKLEASGAYEQAEAAWERSIAEWALVLSDDAYWAGWRQDRAARYRQVVTQSDAARLRSLVGQELLNTLARYADDYAAEGRRERAERYRQLALTLEAELEGARALKEVGGLPLDGDRSRNLVCGPLYLRHTGLGRLLGETIARLESETGGAGEQEDLFTALDAALGTGLGEPSAKVTPDALYRLRCAFSELGKASLLLERHQPEQAIQALPPLYRTKLSDLPADCGRGPALAAGGEEHLAACSCCQAFLAGNPGYLCLPHRRARLLQDAVELATRAYLDLAQAALTTGRQSCEEAIERWRDAIEASRNAGAQVRTKRAIVRVVLGRADALDQERGRQRGERLTEAIELIERARELIGGADEGQLAAKAAEVLTDRGVWYGNGGYEDVIPDFERAAQDLRRALELTPGALHALDNLSRALIFQAANLPPSSGARRSFELFAEALSVLNEGLRRTGGHRQLLSVLAQALDELDERVLFELSPEELSRSIAEVNGGGPGGAASLATLADEKLGRGDDAGALRALIAAVRRDAGDDAIRCKLLEAVERKAHLRS
jgi:hypothetical protein